MINTEVVYKIKLIDLDGTTLYRGDEWAQGTNIFKRGGSGKTWTNEKLVNKSLEEIICNYSSGPKPLYGKAFTAEIVAFELKQLTK